MMNYENLQPEHLCGTLPVIVYGSQSKINLKFLAQTSATSKSKYSITSQNWHSLHANARGA